jgi:hypothetical protein
MRHPARGPIGTMGIDGKPIAASRRRKGESRRDVLPEAAA